MNGYPNTWLSPYTILEKVIFWREIDYDEVIVKKWVTVLTPFCEALQFVRKLFNPSIRYVKIDRYDTWSMDYTLAYIILPMLIQLKETKHGAPFTEDKDVPKELRSTSAPPKENEWDTDDNHFKRWDYILDEMIWAFEQKLKDDDEHQFFDHTGTEGLPFEEKIGKIKVDQKGLKAHQKRKENGFRLFGVYYQNLWD
jgi:hypothetical protein